jgi:hypothetical protein
MYRTIFRICFLLVCVGAGSETLAQRKAVSGAEVTGTFRSYFTGKFKDSYNEILIQALVLQDHAQIRQARNAHRHDGKQH